MDGKKIIIRLNFCSDNILYFEELIDYLSNERILEYEKLRLAFFSIYTNENLEFNSKDIDYCFSKIRESKVLNKYFSNYLLTDILKSLSWIKEYNIPYIFNPFQCGAYTNMMLFGPGNNIYGCDHQISEFKHRIGYIGDDILISKYKLLKKRMIKFYYNLKCINCSFFLLCGNSCFIKKRKLISTEDCVMKKFMNNLIILGFERVFLEANIDKDKEDTNDRSKQLS